MAAALKPTAPGLGAATVLGTTMAQWISGSAAASASRSASRSALLLAGTGGLVLANIELAGTPAGVGFAALNCVFFMLYVVLAHHLAQAGGPGGIDRLALAMMVASLAALPFGMGAAAPAVVNSVLLAASFGVAVCSSVIPYVADQFAMARPPRASFALLLSLLPAMATLIGTVVLGQVLGWREFVGIGLVITGVVLHRPRDTTKPT